MDTRPMPTSEARVPTTAARRYLGQLCKHFEHKLPVALAEHHGRIDFPPACANSMPRLRPWSCACGPATRGRWPRW